MKTKKDYLIIVTNNNSKAQVLKLNTSKSAFLTPTAQEATAIVFLKNGKEQKYEFPFGNGYLTQSSRFIKIPDDAKKIHFFDFSGKVTRKLIVN